MEKKKISLLILFITIIVGLMVFLGIVKITNIFKNSRDAKRIENLNFIGGILEEYYIDHGRYPDDVPFGSKWKIGQKEYEIPQDPLNKDLYIYRYSVSDDRSYYILAARLENPKNSVLEKDIDEDQKNNLPNVFPIVNCDDPVYCKSKL